MNIKKLAIIMGSILLSMSLLNATIIEITKTAGNIPSNMVPGVSNNNETSAGDTPSSIAATRDSLIESGAIKQTSINDKSMFNTQTSYSAANGAGFEWVGTPDEGHVEIATPSGEVIAFTPGSSSYAYSWGDRYFMKDSEGNSYAMDFFDSGNVSFYSYTQGKTMYASSSDTFLKDDSPQSFKDMFVSLGKVEE
ncbi:hypothetical protein EDC55_11020 [Allofrancisella inopinata]|uniref:Uncharacterized protein n=1 Tax=Allofrancisella inopinata TaxID=1085647 RepID=A0AAE7CQN4_9GAMM|nr:hypothetical protein [Allofrancisella inopinata]QIV96031.1 hypothetical protein E4K63_03975 [Allofrancisella inopinata]TDT71688.1 hypothetical protein EDC55_11020 [Allofrancisella inopinata]